MVDTGDPEFQAALIDHAKSLGVDPLNSDNILSPHIHTALMNLVREALLAPIPDGWEQGETEDGTLYYFNTNTEASIWEHPMDSHYRTLIAKKIDEMRLKESSVNNQDSHPSAIVNYSEDVEVTNFMDDSDDEFNYKSTGANKGSNFSPFFADNAASNSESPIASSRSLSKEIEIKDSTTNSNASEIFGKDRSWLLNDDDSTEETGLVKVIGQSTSAASILTSSAYPSFITPSSLHSKKLASRKPFPRLNDSKAPSTNSSLTAHSDDKYIKPSIPTLAKESIPLRSIMLNPSTTIATSNAKVIEDVTSELNKMSKKNGDLEQEIVKLNLEVKEATHLKIKNSELKSKISDLEIEVTRLTVKLKEEDQASKSCYQTLKDQLSAITLKYNESQEMLQIDRTNADTKYENVTKELADQRKKHEVEIEEIREKLKVKEELWTQEKERIICEHKSKCDIVEREKRQTKEEMKQMHDQLVDDINQKNIAELQQLQQNLLKNRTELLESEHQLWLAKSKISSLQSEINSLQQRHVELEETHRNSNQKLQSDHTTQVESLNAELHTVEQECLKHKSLLIHFKSERKSVEMSWFEEKIKLETKIEQLELRLAKTNDFRAILTEEEEKGRKLEMEIEHWKRSNSQLRNQNELLKDDQCRAAAKLQDAEADLAKVITNQKIQDNHNDGKIRDLESRLQHKDMECALLLEKSAKAVALHRNDSLRVRELESDLSALKQELELQRLHYQEESKRKPPVASLVANLKKEIQQMSSQIHENQEKWNAEKQQLLLDRRNLEEEIAALHKKMEWQIPQLAAACTRKVGAEWSDKYTRKLKATKEASSAKHLAERTEFYSRIKSLEDEQHNSQSKLKQAHIECDFLQKEVTRLESNNNTLSEQLHTIRVYLTHRAFPSTMPFSNSYVQPSHGSPNPNICSLNITDDYAVLNHLNAQLGKLHTQFQQLFEATGTTSQRHDRCKDTYADVKIKKNKEFVDTQLKKRFERECQLPVENFNSMEPNQMEKFLNVNEINERELEPRSTETVKERQGTSSYNDDPNDPVATIHRRRNYWQQKYQ